MTFYEDDFSDSISEDDFSNSISEDDSFSLRRHLSSMIPDIRKYTIWLTAMFVVSLPLGYVVGFYTPSLLDTVVDSMNLPETESSFEFMISIFLNNSKAAGMLVFLGFIFAVLPIFSIFMNGMIIGIFSEYVIRTEGFSFLLVGLLPHGIIEIPLILLSAGIGFKMGVGTLQVIFKKKSIRLFLFDFLAAALLFLIVIVPLLLVAALIESYVTGFLLEQLF